MAATHTHAAPRVGLAQGPLDRKYVDRLVEGIARAVCGAIDNLAPARVGWGAGSKPEYVFNRRWYMKPGTVPVDPFGRKNDRVRFNPPAGSPNLVRPAGPVDPEVSVISVRHADGRPLAVLANYGMHYAGGFRRGEVSADYFGVFARRIGELLKAESNAPPFVGMMSNGTSGNIGSGWDFRQPPKDRKKYAPYERMREVGYALADEVHGVVQRIEHRRDVTLAMAQAEIEVGVRRPDEKRLAWAHDVLDHPQKKRPHGWTARYAREAVLLAHWPARVPVKLQAVRIGEAVMGAIPNEVFSETGLAIKRSSPKERTFVIELANQYYGYLPTPEEHALGGYETWDARSSALEVGAEPKIRAKVLDLIGRVCG